MADQWDERNREFRNERTYRNRDDRGIVDRATDEVRSWVGDEEAARRRRMDELRHERHDRDWSDRASSTAERGWDRTRETARDLTDRDRDGRRGLAEWNDADRPGDRAVEPRYGAGRAWSSGVDRGRDRGEYLGRDRYEETSRYAAFDPYGPPRWSSAPASAAGERSTTSYAGRGPRGYSRGDDRIREDVCDRLTDDPRVDASDMEVQVDKGEVTLTGSVRTRDEKRFAEDLVERISGVREVNNSLKVRRTDEVLGTARSGASVLGLNDTPPPPPSKTK